MADAERSKLVTDLLDTVASIAGRAMEAPAFEDLSLMADQLSKMLLSTLSMSGAFRDPEIAAVYRDRSLTPFQRLIAVGMCFMKAVVNDPKFHAEFGDILDVEFSKLYIVFADYFNVAKAGQEAPR